VVEPLTLLSKYHIMPAKKKAAKKATKKPAAKKATKKPAAKKKASSKKKK